MIIHACQNLKNSTETLQVEKRHVLGLFTFHYFSLVIVPRILKVITS
jgi:hypothetical protein